MKIAPKMPHWPKPVGLLQNETSLQRMQEILQRLGNPHLKLPRTIHIAGTNGKGSTLAFLQAMLEAAGHKVHKYITPHLVDFNERITLSGRQISDDELFEVMEQVRVNSENLQLGFYEATTTGAFLAFSQTPADFLLLETGLGGRLDATNIIPAPEITIISSIDKDHTNFLGNTVQEIALQKAYIIKEGTICISSLQHEVVHDVINAWCAPKKIPCIQFGYDFAIEKTSNGFKFLSEAANLQLPAPNLIGDHQYINAASSVAAALQLGINQNAIAQGLQNAKWHSRMEKIEKPFVPEGFELWLDGAHNQSAAFAIANFAAENWADAPLYIIFGTTRGRDCASFLQYFKPIAAEIILTKIPAEINSYDPSEIAAQLNFNCQQSDNIKEAISYFSSKQPGRILCIGSLFMRGDVI